jgi:membrane-associated phospholipid phosphatase
MIGSGENPHSCTDRRPSVLHSAGFTLALAVLAAGGAVAADPTAADTVAADPVAADTANAAAASAGATSADTTAVVAVESTAAPLPHHDRNPVRASVSAVKILVEDGVHVYAAPVRWQGRDWLLLGGSLAVTGVVLAFDREIYEAVQRSKEDPPLRQMIEVGRALDPVGYGRFNTFTFGAMTLAWIAGQDRIALICGQVIEAHLVAGVGKALANELVGRARPYESDDPYEFGRSDATSFPSGHAINMFEIATILSHHVDRAWFTWPAYFCAVCVGLQRVESGSHWPSDVVLSAIFGTAVARTIVRRGDDRELQLSPHVGAEGVGWKVAWRF